MEEKANTRRVYTGPKGWPVITAVAITLLVGAGFVLKNDSRNLPDFSAFDQTSELKEAFFSYLTPIIESQNDVVRKQRSELTTIAATFAEKDRIGFYHRWRLNTLAEAYDVSEDFDTGLKIETLLRRIDIVPLELAAVQAAKESAWGRSRFAVKVNNLFGHWCFDPGCGEVPENRAAGQHHELKAYESVSAAIAGYMLNLNTHPKYLQFRQLRAQLREAEERISGIALADGLLYYSERREAYIKEVKAMIRQYREFTSAMEDNAQT